MTEKRGTRADWADSPLYDLLLKTFPAYRSLYNVFAVRQFAAEPEINLSHEAIYKWLRSGKITPANAKSIIALANRPDNLAALKKARGVPPEMSDLVEFL